MPRDDIKWDAMTVNGSQGYQYAFYRDPLQMSLTGSVLNTNINAHFKAAVSQHIGRVVFVPDHWLRLGSCGDGEPMPHANAHIHSSLSIVDWHLVSRSDFDHPLDIGSCRVMFMNRNVDGHINDVLSPRVQAALAEIDNRIPVITDVKPKAQIAWDKLQAPIPLPRDSWLMLNPSGISVQPIQGSGSTLQTGLMLTVDPTINVGNQPPTGTDPLPSPIASTSDLGFHVVTTIQMPYDDINKALKGPNGIVGKAYPMGEGQLLRVNDAAVYGFGDQSVLEVTIAGWMDGKIYFTGRPVYDQATQSIEVVDFDFSPETATSLSSMDAQHHEALRKQFAKQLRVPLSSQLEALKNEIQAAVNSPVDPRVKLTGHVDDVRGLAILGTDKGYNGYFLISGDVRADVQ